MVIGEKISRRRLNKKAEALIHNSGFILLMILIIVITFRDFNRYGSQIWEGIKNIF